RKLKTGNQVKQCALAAAARAQENDKFIGRHVKVDVGQGVERAVSALRPGLAYPDASHGRNARDIRTAAIQFRHLSALSWRYPKENTRLHLAESPIQGGAEHADC